MSYYTIITGCTSGIGYSLAKEFASNGHNLILIARNKEKLEKIEEELTKIYNVKVYSIVKDLTKENAVNEIFEDIVKQDLRINVLCNNAGVGMFGEFINSEMTQTNDMLKLNINVVVELTYKFIHYVSNYEHSYILNVASTGAFVSGPLMTCYYASKSFVLSFSESLSMELKNRNITVSCLCPGTTKTEFFTKISDSDLTKNLKPMNPDDVAKIAYKGLFKNKVIIIPGFKNKLALLGNKLISRKLSRKIMYKIQNKRSK